MFSRHRNLVLLTLVLSAQLFLLAYQFRRGGDVPLIRHGTMYVVTPVQRAMRAVTDTFGRVIYGYVDLRDPRRQSQDMERELDELRIEAQRLRREASQAKRLQTLLDFRQELPLVTVAAQVIGSDTSETSQTVILDKGSDAGLRPDLPVIIPEGVVGKVLRVFADTSQVLLISDTNSGVAALLESSRIHGVLRGRNQPLAQLTYVVNGEAVRVGEILLTSGEDRIYPKGLPLGVVVTARPSTEFQEIEVQPLAQLNRLEEVLVVMEREANLELEPLSTLSSPAQPQESALGTAAGAIEQPARTETAETPTPSPANSQ
jgi:rod shape-determining protein MreC